MKTVGVLALQGDFYLHARRLEEIGVRAPLVKKPEALFQCDALVMPGGESTTLVKLMRNIGLYEAIPEFAREKPVFGTCAGAILLSKGVRNHPVAALGLIDIDIERNAYGTQIDSFTDDIDLALPDFPEAQQVRGVFIRAPRIVRVGEAVRKVGFHRGEVVMVQSGNILAATFHPEVAETRLIHRYFVEKMVPAPLA
ncbi:MAG: pyridoxal 5'-phosphate synthase glutaminase subunit PdxT [Calditrichaeota bacterium]|nr:pyridoxal 5'-phosphate synthase glutaminase subunit PdxT [Calditrichota bacterium]HQU73767.1 pyridoxal 5'-phosphate synthase glutaminase subunit PdxT [Calditrichia bacterium]